MNRILAGTLAVFAAVAVMTTCGCGNVQLGRDRPEDKSAPAHWRKDKSSEKGPGGIFSEIIHGSGEGLDPAVDPPSFYRQQYILWRRDHKNLSRMIARNSRGTTELLRQVVGSLSGMKEMLEKPEQREELERLQLRYESIAMKSTQGFQPQAFSLALDKIKWKVEGDYAPGSEGLVYRTRGYFQQRELEQFDEEEEDF